MYSIHCIPYSLWLLQYNNLVVSDEHNLKYLSFRWWFIYYIIYVIHIMYYIVSFDSSDLDCDYVAMKWYYNMVNYHGNIIIHYA